ncbi:Crp/Fnr family transcriptional regulator [Streptomyces sp. NPDC006514]|uniref:Crp/Fnr family transcriptional regulator n=1 Tax=Streptomyces sp. NPDC006514 TaxID=3154308 RepID=UPI0033BCDEDE
MTLPMGGGGSAQRPGHGHWPAASLLGRLSEEPREQLVRLGREARFERGERLLREGEYGSYVFLLLSGWYKVLARTQDDREGLLAVRAGGDLVGELACFDAQPRVATVVAAGTGSAKLIARQPFLDLLATYEEAAQAVMCTVAGKLRWATRRRQDFGGCPVGTRVARVLLELARAYGHPCATGVSIGVSLTQPELAELVGASEPSVHRELRSLRERGVVETGYRRVLVRDLSVLTIVADGDAPQRNVPAGIGHGVAAAAITPTRPTPRPA